MLAEDIAKDYEFNSHLALIRLLCGHIAWNGDLEEWGIGFDAALKQYQQALIYSLRYNRFLLDDTLETIITHSLERDDKGHKMLATIHDWWQTGLNELGKPRPDTISLIPEGILLIEAERITRQNEPGDDRPQVLVLEQLMQ